LAFELQAVWLVPGVHCSHWLAGFVAAVARHVPLMTQFPAAIVWVQVPSPLQESAVQRSESSQLYVVPTHAPAAVHLSLLLHRFPSSQDVPVVFKVQAVWLVATVHCWHWFVGLAMPLA
jgi:hypothetical protein